MPEHPDAADVLAMLRTAELLLREQADQLRRYAIRESAHGNQQPIQRYRKLLAIADGLGALAAEIAAEAERR